MLNDVEILPFYCISTNTCLVFLFRLLEQDHAFHTAVFQLQLLAGINIGRVDQSIHTLVGPTKKLAFTVKIKN